VLQLANSVYCYTIHLYCERKNPNAGLRLKLVSNRHSRGYGGQEMEASLRLNRGSIIHDKLVKLRGLTIFQFHPPREHALYLVPLDLKELSQNLPQEILLAGVSNLNIIDI
jgi:hypothetical protein